MKHKDFCIFILTHGRADRVVTYDALQKKGCKYPIFIVIDNEDKEAAKYREKFGERVVMFNKIAIGKKFDAADNFENRKCIIYARNACFEIAKKLGFKYFLELDDDYNSFRFKFNQRLEYGDYEIRKIDPVLNTVLTFFKKIPALTISLSQGGDFMGGKLSDYAEDIRIKRKAMNTFFCSTERPFKFVGRINEDVNTYVSRGMRGDLIFQINQLAINQLTTQANAGGMTETYLDEGTYVKSFYSILFAPSCVSIRVLGQNYQRLHHHINWECAVPKIVRESVKKIS